MMCVGVEMASYLCHLGYVSSDERVYKSVYDDLFIYNLQFDDVGMTKGAHILNFALDTTFSFVAMDGLLGYVFHGDGMASDGMDCLWGGDDKVERLDWRGEEEDGLLTLAKLPWAISPTTVYSPSFEGG
jgi:hypothetical protein